MADTPRVGPALQQRAMRLRARVIDALAERARRNELDEPELRTRAAFGALELTTQAMYLEPDTHGALARHYREMAIHVLGG